MFQLSDTGWPPILFSTADDAAWAFSLATGPLAYPDQSECAAVTAELEAGRTVTRRASGAARDAPDITVCPLTVREVIDQRVAGVNLEDDPGDIRDIAATIPEPE